MEHFDRAFRYTLASEGGYVNDPADSGGATRYGITKRVARKHGYEGDMSHFPFLWAKEIYRKEYWNAVEGDAVSDLSPSIAMEVFDSAVNTGPRRASEWLQRALNVLNNKEAHYKDLRVDGDIGGNTLKALKAFLDHRGADGETVLLRALNSLQGEFYIQLAERRPKDERFVYGWLLQRVS